VSVTVISRSVCATPKRSALETWAVIVGIIAPDAKDPAREELTKVSGVAASCISAEAPKNDAIVVFGGGPRLRIYCLYNDDAILGDSASEDPVRESVTGDGWRLSLPCEEDDLEWIQRKLKSLSSKVTARKLGDDPPAGDEEEKKSLSAASAPAVDLKEFFKP
jgi:hypothetical protein